VIVAQDVIHTVESNQGTERAAAAKASGYVIDVTARPEVNNVPQVRNATTARATRNFVNRTIRESPFALRIKTAYARGPRLEDLGSSCEGFFYRKAATKSMLATPLLGPSPTPMVRRRKPFETHKCLIVRIFRRNGRINRKTHPFARTLRRETKTNKGKG
jgi:hypothetical protein